MSSYHQPASRLPRSCACAVWESQYALGFLSILGNERQDEHIGLYKIRTLSNDVIHKLKKIMEWKKNIKNLHKSVYRHLIPNHPKLETIAVFFGR